MKKLILLFIISVVMLGISACEDDSVQPDTFSSADKLEIAFEGYDFILDIFQNNYDDNYYAILVNRDTVQYNIFKSTDLGATWQLEDVFTKSMISPTLDKFYDTPTIIYGKDDYTFFYLHNKIFRKAKNQSKFDLLNIKIDTEDRTYYDQFGYQFNFVDKDGILFASDFVKSSDNGETWTDINKPYNTSVYSTAIDNYIVVKADNSEPEYQYYVSADKGESWTESTFDYSRNDNNSEYLRFYNDEYIAYNLEPKQIKKPSKEELYIYDITKNNTVIAYETGYFDHDKDNFGDFSIYTSKDDGENWKFHFSFDSRTGSFYTKSGYIYFNSTSYNYHGIKRNKTPLK